MASLTLYLLCNIDFYLHETSLFYHKLSPVRHINAMPQARTLVVRILAC